MNSLGTKKVHRNPNYYLDKLGRVTSSANFRSKGRIEVQFLDHGKCMPVWVVGDVDREPVQGDMVIIGYMEGRKDAPYLKAFVRNETYTANYIEVGKEYIRFQLPKTAEDRGKHMTEDAKKPSRVYLELNASGISLYHPDGDIFLNTPKGNVKTITKTGAQTF
jgi:hypothetical protein